MFVQALPKSLLPLNADKPSLRPLFQLPPTMNSRENEAEFC